MGLTRKTLPAAAAAAVSLIVLAACSSAPAAHPATARPAPAPLYSQPGPITCTVTRGAVLVVRVPGDGLRARLSEVITEYGDGNSQFEHDFAVTGGIVPAHGTTLTWDDRPGRITRCKVTSYLP